MESFRELKHKIQFSKVPVLSLINPLYIIRRGLRRELSAHSKKFSGKSCLDVGCGAKPHKDLFEFEKYIGIDVEVSGHDHSTSSIDAFFDGLNIPYDNELFSHVFCSEVLEHVEYPQFLVREMHRVLEMDGKILITVPFIWPLHELPYDFRRFTDVGITKLLEDNGFEIEDRKVSGGTLTVLIQLFVEFVHRSVHQRNKTAANLLLLPTLIPLNLLASFLSKFDHLFQGLFFNTIVLAKKVPCDYVSELKDEDENIIN